MSLKYHMPTKVFIGENCIIENKEVFKSLGKKALIVTGARSAKINGSQSDVISALDSVGISYLIFDKVMSNPTIACVYEGAKIARENNVDFIIAIGGGSPMDAGKAIALLAAQDIKEENLFSGVYENKVLPMVYIPTTAGTGSEVTQYSILTNDKAKTKMSIATELIFPTIAFLDAKYTLQLPLTTTINTAVDALSHAVEGMLSIKASFISDTLACESIKMITNCIPKILKSLKNPDIVIDKNTREQLLYASFMAGIVIAQTGTTAVHAMGYSLTYFKDIDHGRANGLLLGEFLKFVEKENPDRIKKILEAMNLNSTEEFINLMDELLGTKENITRDEIDEYSDIAMKTKNISNCIVKPKKEDLIKMYQEVFN
ncbi:iron-containing alcohol dehydrogenase family protein [Defluviitalea phaphyphila]|uniref:iron-containing alcohol dehydrogenase family protein n=1 Tax=Defluviitalea phaphyphila TaxID=1473580 RepID=UPI0007319A51|nr:iron-containing alcohol dehydrogenase family protein [Defluviitalea phaphyphila]